MAKIEQDPEIAVQVAMQKLSSAVLDGVAKDSYIIQCENRIDELEASIAELQSKTTAAQ